MEGIRRNFPEKLPLYESLYSENRPSGAPFSRYTVPFYERFSRELLERKISPLIPHTCWKGVVSLADEIYLLLSHLEFLYQMRHIDITPLQSANKAYVSWIKGIRTDFNRRRSLSREYLDDFILMNIRTGFLAELFDNEKLGIFFRDVLENGKIFDYTNCRLSETIQKD
jgi:hypothetical protein